MLLANPATGLGVLFKIPGSCQRTSAVIKASAHKKICIAYLGGSRSRRSRSVGSYPWQNMFLDSVDSCITAARYVTGPSIVSEKWKRRIRGALTMASGCQYLRVFIVFRTLI